MPTPSPKVQVSSQAVRAGVVGSHEPLCIVCGGPRDPGKREACSAKCRAVLSRHRKDQARAHRDREIRALLAAALHRLEED